MGAASGLRFATTVRGVTAAWAEARRRPRPAESAGERLANVATHGAGIALAASAWLAMQDAARRAHDPWAGASVAVFGATLLLVYTVSTVYHAATAPRARARLRRLDKAAIFLLIAGTYTPFCALGIGGPAGRAMLVFEWTLAALGVALQARRPGRNEGLTIALYLAMGWAALPFVHGLAAVLGEPLVGWLAAGGIAYTSGLVFFASRRPYAHAVWHVFVLTGSAAHVHAVLSILLPRC